MLLQLCPILYTSNYSLIKPGISLIKEVESSEWAVPFIQFKQIALACFGIMALYNKCIDNNQVCLKVVILKGHYTHNQCGRTLKIYFIYSAWEQRSCTCIIIIPFRRLNSMESYMWVYVSTVYKHDQTNKALLTGIL